MQTRPHVTSLASSCALWNVTGNTALFTVQKASSKTPSEADDKKGRRSCAESGRKRTSCRHPVNGHKKNFFQDRKAAIEKVSRAGSSGKSWQPIVWLSNKPDSSITTGVPVTRRKRLKPAAGQCDGTSHPDNVSGFPTSHSKGAGIPRLSPNEGGRNHFHCP